MWPFGRDAKNRLEDALHEHDLTSDLDLEVEVMSGRAFISAEVPNQRYKDLILSIANGINGIDEVDLSGIVVADGDQARTPQSSADAGQSKKTSDSATTDGEFDPGGHAKLALEKIKGEPSLAKNPLDVLHRGSTVVLRGAVDSQAELDRARALVLSVAGISDVDTSGLQVVEDASRFNLTDEAGDYVYTVQSDDTLADIAQRFYGDGGRDSYMRIAEANDISDPDRIQAGQKLMIPGTNTGPGEPT